MISTIRQAYNQAFTAEKYQHFLEDITNSYNHTPPFRIAETPVFVGKDFKAKLYDACEELIDVIVQPDFKEMTKGAIEHNVPNEDDHTLFLQFDFGICEDGNGGLIPQLIETQGFPSLYFFQDQLSNFYKKHFDVPTNYSHLFGGLTSESYIQLLRNAIIGDSNPENVILLEIEPKKQATLVDFIGAEDYLGIKTICVSDLKKDGKDVYYEKDGKLIQVKKIVNRVIFDELLKRNDLKREFSFADEHNIEWVGHPNWFFRISKYTLPFFKSKYVPKTEFLHQITEIPEDLENYVLKPLYSFSGTGVVFNVTKADIEAISEAEKHHYILQKKVTYSPVLQAPDGKVKCEVRMLMLWDKNMERPIIVNNLMRLSKGDMVGVRYNKDKAWVGATAGFFEV